MGAMCGCGNLVTGWGERPEWKRGWERQLRVLAFQDGGKKGAVLDGFVQVLFVQEFGRCCWVGICDEPQMASYGA